MPARVMRLTRGGEAKRVIRRNGSSGGRPPLGETDISLRRQLVGYIALIAAEPAPSRLSLHLRPVAAHRRILALAWGAWAAGFYSLMLLSFLLQPVQDAFGLSEAGLARLTAVAVGMSGAGGLLFGWMSDRVGRRASLGAASATCGSRRFTLFILKLDS